MAKLRIKLVLPDFFNEKKLIAAATRAVDKTLDEIERDFQSSVKDFTHQPAFTKKKAVRQGNKIVGSVGTDDENYRRLNDGTTAHYVPKSGRRRMTFRAGYKKKTRRGRIPSVQGGGEGGYITRTGRWMIKGINPRAYDEFIKVKNEIPFKRNVEQAIQSLT